MHYLLALLPYLAISVPQIGVWLNIPFILVIVAWVMAILLVLEIPLIALKFKTFSFQTQMYLGTHSWEWGRYLFHFLALRESLGS